MLSLTTEPPAGTVTDPAPPNVTVRPDPATMDDPPDDCANWTSEKVTGWLPNTLESLILAAVPPIEVRTICRMVCRLYVAELDCGATAHVPVQSPAAARAVVGRSTAPAAPIVSAIASTARYLKQNEGIDALHNLIADLWREHDLQPPVRCQNSVRCLRCGCTSDT